MVKLKEPIRIIGVIIICFALFNFIRTTIYNIQIIGLTPEKCTEEVEGRVIDYEYGSKMQYGRIGGHSYSVYYDVIEYEVNGHTYKITSRHAYKSKPVVGAMTTVHYNPNNPSKAYDNSEPYADNSGYFIAAMYLILGLAIFFRLDKVISSIQR